MIYFQKLHVAHYKILRDFTLSFKTDPLVATTVLIGDNGAGKSTILECLTWIFRALHETYTTRSGRPREIPFDFRLDYLHSNTSIEGQTVNWIDTHTVYTQVRVEGRDGNVRLLLLKSAEPELWAEPPSKEAARFLPNVILYYAGLSEVIQRLYQPFDRGYQRTFTRENKQQDSFALASRLPLYYFTPGDLPLLLAGLYAYEDNERIEEAFFKLGLRPPAVDTLEIAIRRNTYTVAESDRTIDNLWGATGALRRLQAVLMEYATQKKEPPTTERPGRYTNGLTLHFDLAAWQQVRRVVGGARDLFALLLQLRASHYIDTSDFIVRYERNDFTAPHTTLSEGEQQRLTLRALCELLVDESSLVMLDEPDTYQHPRWQSEMMKEFAVYSEFAPFLITTHSPLLLANFKDGNLFTMAGGKATFIKGHYYGRTYGDTIRDVLGTDEDRAPEVEGQFDDLFGFIDAGNWRKADAELAKLREMVGPDDLELVQAETMLRMMRPEEEEDGDTDDTTLPQPSPEQ